MVNFRNTMPFPEGSQIMQMTRGKKLILKGATNPFFKDKVALFKPIYEEDILGIRDMFLVEVDRQNKIIEKYGYFNSSIPQIV